MRPGRGTYRVGDTIYASILGYYDPRPPVAQVIPLAGRYIPRPGDTVIGTVTDAQGTFWLLDVGAPRWAPLHITGTPWKVEVGETQRYLHVGDAVLARVESLDPTGRIGVTMLGEGLGKLDGGTIVTISPAKVPRVIGRRGSMIETITRMTGAEVAIGQNGRIWVSGTPDAIERVSEALRMIDEEGHRRGLTQRVEGYLTATSARAPPLIDPRLPSVVQRLHEPRAADGAEEPAGPDDDGPSSSAEPSSHEY